MFTIGTPVMHIQLIRGKGGANPPRKLGKEVIQLFVQNFAAAVTYQMLVLVNVAVIAICLAHNVQAADQPLGCQRA